MAEPEPDVELATWVQGWPADHVAAAVTDAEHRLAATGPLQREFRIASLAKLFTALAVLVAVEEGSVSLDDPVGPAGSTLRHTLCHASGLAFDQQRSLAPPGRRRIYSNVGIEAAAAHVEAATAISFADYLDEAVFGPLGLRHTALRGSPASDVFSTAADMTAAARHFLRPTVVHVVTFAEAVSPQFPDLAGVVPGLGRFAPNPWGLGFEVRGGKQPHWTGHQNSPATFGHFGGSGAFLWVDPKAGLGCVVLTDREFGAWALQCWPAFSDRVLERFALRA
jgi:CubicO group peptidase (beta-lactamase class C family)